MKLYEISDIYRQALAELSDSDLDVETVQATLEGIEGELEAKLLSVLKVAATLDAESKAIGEAIDKMAKREGVLTRNAEWLRAYALQHMQACGIYRLEDAEMVVRRTKNPPKVVIHVEHEIPSQLMRIIPERREPDKAGILRILKDGEGVPGCSLSAGERLRIG